MSLISGGAPGKLAKRNLLREVQSGRFVAANRLAAFLFDVEDLCANTDAPFARHAGCVRRNRVIYDTVADIRTARGNRNPAYIWRRLPGAVRGGQQAHAAAAAACRK